MRLTTLSPPLTLLAIACGGGTGPDAPEIAQTVEATVEPPADASPAVALDAVVPTQIGGPVLSLFDGVPERGWTPADDSADEGVLLRFAEPVALDALRVSACGDDEPWVQLYVNGAGGEPGTAGTFPVDTEVRTAFVRIRSDGPVCLGEITGIRAGEEVRFTPPRQVQGRLQASSTLEPAAAYHPAWLFDGRVDFAWVEGASGEGVGTTLTLELQEPVELHALELHNGYQRSEDHFQKNGRLAKLGVQVDDKPARSLPVEDALGPQRLALDPPLSGKRWVFTIEDAVRGTRYRDLVISELRLLDAEGPLTVETLDALALQDLNRRAVAGTPLESLLDKQLTSVCEADASRMMKLRSNHSFVSYSTSSLDTGAATAEVFDGSWVPTDGAIKLYGRRHTVRRSFSPYGSTDADDSTRVAGGTVNVTSVAELGADGLRSLLARWRAAGVAAVQCAEAEQPPVEQWAAAGAIVLEGPALTDILLP